jgi:RNA polymerase sigma-70 factor (ECF subfamily)
VSNTESVQIAEIERHREYLARIAQLQIDPRLQGKIDLSGVVQQTLWDAVQGFQKGQLDNSAARLAWLRKTLAYNLIDEVRKLTGPTHDAFREQSIEHALEQSSLRLNCWLAAELSSPSHKIDRDEWTMQLTAAMSRLLPSERDVVVLRHLQDWSLVDIAAHVGRTPAAVAGLLKRALRKLRDDFANIED